MVLVGGEPGIGKTTLVSEAARALPTSTARSCYTDAATRICRSHINRGLKRFAIWSTTRPTQCSPRTRPELARLVPEVTDRRPNVAAPPSSDADTDRYVLFGAVTSLLAAASAAAPVVVVLDDLHWADRPTAQLLRHVASSDTRMRVLVIGTFREAEIGANHTLADTLAALHRDGRAATRLNLHGLGDVELLELLELNAGHELDDIGGGLGLRDALLAETDGNPFFVAEILRHLAETGAIRQHDNGRWTTTADLRATGLPVSVREVLGRRVAHLGETALRVLSAASVIGRDFDLNTLTMLVDTDEDTLLDTLEEAETANLLVDAGPGRFSFAHTLVEHALYDELGSTRRARLHRRVGEIIEAQTHGEPGDRIGELAHHWAEAVAPQDITKACEYARQAGDYALGRLAPDEALRWYARGLELLGHAGAGAERFRCALLIGLGEAQRQTADPTYRQTLLDAADLAGRVGDNLLLVQAALANNRGFTSSTGFVDTERVDVLRGALDRVGASDPKTRALLLALLAAELNYNNEPAQRRLLADEARTLARKCGDRRTLLRVLNTTHDTISAADLDLDELARLENEAIALARELDDPVGTFMALVNATGARYASGRSCEDLVDECTAIAEHLRQPTLRWVARTHTPLELFRRGDVSGAEVAVEEGFALGTDVGEPDAITFYAGQLANVRWAQGRRAELVPLLAPVAEELEDMPSAHAIIAVCHLDAGDTDAAQALLRTELPKVPATPTDQLWIHAVIVWSEVTARLADAHAATSLIERLRPYIPLFVFSGGTLEGSVADALGRLATVLGDYNGADECFDIADTVNERLNAPFFIALTKLHRAEMQLRRDADGDRERAHELLVEVLEIARQHGFAGVERDALDLQRR